MSGSIVLAAWIFIAIPWILITANTWIANVRNDKNSLPSDIAMVLLPFCAGSVVLVPGALCLTVLWIIIELL